MWAYSIAGPLRGATLMGLMVVVVFCTFALRPRQTLMLTAVGLCRHGRHHVVAPGARPAALSAAGGSRDLRDHGRLLDGGDPADRRDASKLRARLKAQKEDLVRRWTRSAPWPPSTN
jgi:hypothetical protein